MSEPSHYEPSVILPPVPVDPETADSLVVIARIESVTPAALVRRVLGQYADDYGPWDD
jgi:hypothetical protein